jgi:hypothetical protein
VRRIVALVCVSLLFVPALPRAEPLSGQDDPRFQAALALWLADDEATALPELAALAAEGNRAAEVLVARIDVTPQLRGPWLVARSKAERTALMRAPGGLSGRSWMIAAAADEPLAQLWRQRDDPASGVDTAIGFASLGEDRAARDMLQALAARQYRGFAAVADDPDYPPELRHLIWREWAADPAGRARIDAEIAALPPGDPQIQRFRSGPVSEADLDAWLAAAPLAAPLRSFCAASCPETAAACARALLVVVDGHAGLAATGTPSETLIPPETWNASPRGRAALLRQAPARYRIADAFARDVTAEDACVGAALATESARFPD